MAIAVRESPEPRSEQARTSDVLLIESDVFRLLRHELRRYCNREIAGRSFLIAGHRGAGKTTLVENAWLDIWKENEAGTTRLRPLYVQMHGPSLFPDDAALTDIGARKAAVSAGKRADATPAPGKSGETAAEGSDAATAAADQASSKSKGGESKETLAIRRVLEQMVLCLHRAVTAEFARDYWRRVTTSVPPSPVLRRRWERRRDPELAAQFEVELAEAPSPARLREFFSYAGASRFGVLHRGDGSLINSPDTRWYGTAGQQTGRELVALARVCEAHRRISGTYQRTDKLVDADARKALWERGFDAKGAQLIQPLISLTAGAVAGVGAQQASGSLVAGSLTGLLTALGSAMVFKSSSSRSHDRTLTRESSFLFNLSIDTLDRVVPLLIAHLMDAGLAPVFVVDELDKVTLLSTRLLGMVHHLKKLVAESAFFCFLTDRLYYEQMTARQRQIAYPVEYTYFTHRMYVTFKATDCHAYLGAVLQPPAEPVAEAAGPVGGAAESAGTSPPSPAVDPGAVAAQRERASDRLDAEVLPYVVLHRARLHTVDMRRMLARWQDGRGRIWLRPGEVRSSMQFRLDVLIQLAIECVLDGDALRPRLLNDPDGRRIAHDALFFITRQWVETRTRDGKSDALDLGDAKVADERFRTYLRDRMGKDAPTPAQQAQARARRTRSRKKTPAPANVAPDEADLLEGVDVPFLYDRVRDLARLLSSPPALQQAVEQWKAVRSESGLPFLPTSVLETVRLLGGAAEGDRAPLQLLEPVMERGRTVEHRYAWRFEPSGIPIGARARPAAPAGDVATGGRGWEADAEAIEAWNSAVLEVTA